MIFNDVLNNYRGVNTVKIIDHKKITRRNMLKLAFAISLPNFFQSKASAEEKLAIKQTDITNHYDGNWANAFKSAFAIADIVLVPKGIICNKINTTITIPDNKELIIDGEIIGMSKAAFVLGNNTKINGNKGKIKELQLIINGSNIKIDGVEMNGYSSTARIMIGGEKELENLTINNLYIHDSNYGILRQGKKSSIKGVVLSNCKFENLQGDAIEWNVGINDDRILISNHEIININNTNNIKYWGIGIGLSGTHYDNNYPDSKTIKNFIVENIVGKNVRQLIHVENGKNFIIRNINAKNINKNYSVNSGLDCATIAIYGSDNFVINNINIENGYGIFIGFGIIHGQYVAAPQNFKIDGVVQKNSNYIERGMKIELGNDNSYVTIKNVDIEGANIDILNRPKFLKLENIKVKSLEQQSSLSNFNLDRKSDSRYRFSVKNKSSVEVNDVFTISPDGHRRRVLIE